MQVKPVFADLFTYWICVLCKCIHILIAFICIMVSQFSITNKVIYVTVQNVWSTQYAGIMWSHILPHPRMTIHSCYTSSPCTTLTVGNNIVLRIRGIKYEEYTHYVQTYAHTDTQTHTCYIDQKSSKTESLIVSWFQ